LKTEVSSTSLSNLKRDATLFSYDAQDNGFENALREHNLQEKEHLNIESEDYSIPGVGGIRSAITFAFRNEKGDISDILENDDYYLICQLKSITAPGFKSFEQVKEEVKNNLKKEKLNSLTLDKANDLLIDLTGTNLTLEKMLTPEDGIEIIKEDIKTLSQSFTSIGKNSKITGALLSSEIGKILGPLETNRGYAIIQIKDLSDFDSTEYTVQKELIRSSIFNRKQNHYFQNWLDDLRNNADIVDNRKFYF
jgi:hypothetical protein